MWRHGIESAMQEILKEPVPLFKNQCGYRFSAYWLRSSVVSVLISLISGMLCINTTHILILFVAPGYELEVHFNRTTGCIDVALQSNAAH